jgi:hypothetical protein
MLGRATRAHGAPGGGGRKQGRGDVGRAADAAASLQPGAGWRGPDDGPGVAETSQGGSAGGGRSVHHTRTARRASRGGRMGRRGRLGPGRGRRPKRAGEVRWAGRERRGGSALGWGERERGEVFLSFKF